MPYFYQFLCAFEDGVADFAFEGAYFNNNINNFIQQLLRS